ncbi:MAG: chorismate-binding protein [Gloeobacteraceae cyanobacterium ES-bin-144]|nr:chorismate-binding protein [Verrucomicrobiales bacterium]
MENSTNSVAWLVRRDGSAIIGYGPFEEVSEPPADGIAFYLQDFVQNDLFPWRIPSRFVPTTRAELTTHFKNPSLLDCHWNALDTAPFSVVFQEIMSSIHSGIFEKTVPVVTETGLATHAPGPAIISAVTRKSSPLQSYGWANPSSGFAGATPELLFSMNGKHLQTMALAGTARSEDREVFAMDEKEIREHEYVAQTLVSKLDDLGKLKRHSREILNLGSIVHFLTLIEVELHAFMAPADLLLKLHPTPALGPLPRTDGTMAQLLGWRNRLNCPPQFGAPFGLWERGRFDAVVAIRGIWWEGKNLSIPAGCGIIEASRLVNEWRELRIKRDAVKRFLEQP